MLVLGARGAAGYVLGRGAGSAAQWWMAAGVTPVAAYAPKGAASLAASYTNLANPGTYDAAPGTAPTWDATGGWTFSGVDQYLRTGIIPAAATWSYVVRYSNASNTGWLFGSSNGSKFTGISPYNTVLGKLRYHNHSDAVSGTLGNQPSGVIAMADRVGYFNGSSDATIPAATYYSLALHIGGRNNSGAAGNFINAKIQALAIYSATLSAAQVATVTAAMNLL